MPEICKMRIEAEIKTPICVLAAERIDGDNDSG
jgi:hypothetical protein